MGTRFRLYTEREGATPGSAVDLDELVRQLDGLVPKPGRALDYEGLMQL